MPTIAVLHCVSERPAGTLTTTRTTRRCVTVAARRGNKSDPLRKGRGYISEDNSGRGNVFGTVPDKLYVSSPTADKVSKSGIGGLQGVAVLGAALVAVLVVTTGVLRFEDGDDLKAVAQLPQADTLTALAQRLRE